MKYFLSNCTLSIIFAFYLFPSCSDNKSTEVEKGKLPEKEVVKKAPITPGTEGFGGIVVYEEKGNALVVTAEDRSAHFLGEAKEACENLVINGHDDWRLPSKDELNLIYQNLAKNGIGNFARKTYYSSTGGRGSEVWVQGFDDGVQGMGDKLLHARFCAVRIANTQTDADGPKEPLKVANGGIIVYEANGIGLVVLSEPLGVMNWDEAKIACENLTINGFDDWHLPSMEEGLAIIQLYNQGFKFDGKRWTSRFDEKYGAWVQYAENNGSGGSFSSTSQRYNVLAVRAFGPNSPPPNPQLEAAYIKEKQVVNTPSNNSNNQEVDNTSQKKKDKLPNKLPGDKAYGGIIVYEHNGHGLVITENSLGFLNWNDANTVGDNLVSNGYNDWYLPYEEEADQIAKLFKKGFNFTGDIWIARWYESERQFQKGLGLVLNSTGSKRKESVDDKYDVFAVRKF